MKSTRPYLFRTLKNIRIRWITAENELTEICWESLLFSRLTKSWVLIWKRWDLFVFTLCIWVQLRQISIFCWYLAWWNFFLFSHKKLESGHDSYLWKHVLDFRLFDSWYFAQVYESKSRVTLAIPCMICQ